tara:strand:- start:546 stop:1877 length:1332 start_codon:yes stop_codon:yes gene_type:complete
MPQRRQTQNGQNRRRSFSDLGAGIAYQNTGFQNAGGDFSDSIKSSFNEISKNEKIRKKDLKREEDRVGLMVEGFMANMSDDIDLTTIQDKDQPVFNEFLLRKKEEYSALSNIASNAVLGSPEKLEAINGMKLINTSFKNLKNSLNTYGGQAEDYLLDKKKNNLSTANSSEDMITAGNIYSGQYQTVIGEDGVMGFDDGQGNITSLRDIKSPFEKAWKQGDQLNEIYDTMYNNGVEITPEKETYYTGKFSRMIDDAGVEGLKSLAFDELVGGKSFFSEEERYMIENLETDDIDALKEAKDSIKQSLITKMIDIAKKQSSSGYSAKQALISKAENKDNANNIDISSMIVRDSFDSGDIILPNKNPNDLNSNKVHSLQKERTVKYNTAAVLTDKNYRVTPVEEEQRGYRKDQFAVSVTDARGIEVAGPFYSEEDLSGFLELIQSQK